ncbi:geranylgeranyl reductase family protein [Iamia sp. SCSIO 61187]|uniref:geranylgeranyl reductase family protein n=1 Tax=Iamia sp. SCSIO 61187 TaxID=2722752 RepID=UPI001C6305BA|nr:geranylgeranyl reductase family protein [Iamia sp. SCSIO 61187]QYG94824.1 geranylgeranyl reductase family protein [Iamia sp. SCSIO 61187]
MTTATPPPERCDVLVVGGGPAGSATAHWLAKAGRDVVVVEKKTFPREKTCGDGLTPRAVHQLEDMGLGPALEGYHRYDGLRAVAHGVTLELKWPEHPVYPSHGYVVRRRDLDEMVAERAVALGATLHTGTEAVRPLQRDGLVVGAVVKDKGAGVEREIHARYVVVADGANSRFGRALGTARNRTYPMGIAIRTYYESPLHDEPWIESALDVRDRQGRSLPGYGWIFPVGDGTINVGIGLLSTFKGYREVNTSHLMEEFANTLPDYWGIDPDSPTCAPTGGRIPMAQSINPKIGPTWVAVGDAAGSVNPFNGEGIDYAYETGRLVAELLDEAIGTGDGMALQRYPALIAEEYGLYFRVARLFSVVIGNPAVMRELTRVGMQSRSLMDWVLRIMANLLREDELGPAEAAYKAVAAIVRTIPEPSA